MRTIVLLTISNILMSLPGTDISNTKDTPLWMAIMATWGIAFVEYCFLVPANRIGQYDFSATQLKTIRKSSHSPSFVCFPSCTFENRWYGITFWALA